MAAESGISQNVQATTKRDSFSTLPYSFKSENYHAFSRLPLIIVYRYRLLQWVANRIRSVFVSTVQPGLADLRFLAWKKVAQVTSGESVPIS